MPLLNFDILSLIVDELSTQEALLISTTSKAVHGIILHHVLSSVTINTSKAISKFPHFILVDPSSRIPLLRSLDVTIPFHIDGLDSILDIFTMFDIEDECEGFAPIRAFASFLTHLFSQSHNLRMLKLNLAGYFFVKYPQLQEAFINMDCLVELSLHDVTGPMLHVIKDMRSQLRFLMLLYPCPNQTVGQFPSYFANMIPQQRLERLIFCVESEMSATFPHGMETQWPTVHSLTVEGDSPMTPFVSAFPSVRSLQVNLSNSLIRDKSPHWTSLDYLAGGDADFQTWYICCPVKWLELHTVLTATDGYEDTIDVIQRTSPMILSLHMLSNLRSMKFWKTLGRAAKHVKLLEVSVEDGWQGRKYMQSWMANAARFMAKLQVLCLSIHFMACIGTSDEENERLELEVREATSGIQNLLANSLPKLQFVTITYDPCIRRDGRDENIWWQIRQPQGVGEEAVVEPIPRWKGEKLKQHLRSMDYEVLSKLHDLYTC